MNISLHLPINNVSFGQVSIGILRYIKEKGLSPNIFPIGQIDPSFQDIDQEFAQWLQTNINKSVRTHKKSDPIFKLWHLTGSLESFSNDQYLFTFYELDSPTPEELNIIKNQKLVFVSNKYTKNIFELHDCQNIVNVPLYFDKYNFKQTKRNYSVGDRVTFNVVGKFEKRKNHEKIIKLWIKKYGNNPKFFLNCAIYNPFISPEDNNKIISYLTEGKKYFNVQFLGMMPKNSLYNDYLNSADVVIGCGTEGWALPEFHSVALGKHALILNAAGYKEWANEENAVIINPNGKTAVYDNMFFKEGQPFNQGNIFTFSDEDFYNGLDKVINRVLTNRVNENGLLLQKKFTVENTVENIFNNIK